MLVSRGYLKEIRHGITYIFCFAMAVLLYYQKNEDQSMSANSRGLFKAFVGKEGTQDILERNLFETYKLVQEFVGLNGEQKKQKLDPEQDPPHNHKENQLCSHKNGCISNAAIGFIRSFIIGTSLSFLPLLLSPKQLIKSKTYSLTRFRFGMFMGTLTGGTRAIQCLLRYIRGIEDGKNQLFAGFLAGFAFFFNGSIEISMYMASKAAESIYNSFIKSRNIKPIPHGEILLFSFTTALLFYTSLFEPHNLRPSYIKFLNRGSAGFYGIIAKKFAGVREAHGVPQLERYNTWWATQLRENATIFRD